MARKNQFVVRHPEGWAVKGEGNSRATRVFTRQWEAIEYGKEVAMNQRSILIIHNRKGVERDRMDYTDYRPYSYYTSSYSWRSNTPFQLISPVAAEPEQAQPEQESIQEPEVNC